MTDLVLIVFLTAMTKYMTKDNSRKKVFILAQGLTVPSMIVKSPQQKRKAGGCIMSGVRKQREINVVILACFFSLVLLSSGGSSSHIQGGSSLLSSSPAFWK